MTEEVYKKQPLERIKESTVFGYDVAGKKYFLLITEVYHERYSRIVSSTFGKGVNRLKVRGNWEYLGFVPKEFME